MLVHPKTPVGIYAPLNVNAADLYRSASPCFAQMTSQSRDFALGSRLLHDNVVIKREFDICPDPISVEKCDLAEGSNAIETAQHNSGSGFLADRHIRKSGGHGTSDGSDRYLPGATIQDRGISSDICIRYQSASIAPFESDEVCEPRLASPDGCGPEVRADAATVCTSAGTSQPQASDTYLGCDDLELMARAKHLREVFCGFPSVEAIRIGAEILRRSILAAGNC